MFAAQVAENMAQPPVTQPQLPPHLVRGIKSWVHDMANDTTAVKQELEKELLNKCLEQMHPADTKTKLKKLEDQIRTVEAARGNAIKDLEEERKVLEDTKKELTKQNDQIGRLEDAREKAKDKLADERKAFENYKKLMLNMPGDVRHSCLKTLVPIHTDLLVIGCQ